MTDETTRDRQSPLEKQGAPLPPNGPSTNRGQVPGGLEGSIMEPPSERSEADNAGDKPAGDERRSDDN